MRGEATWGVKWLHSFLNIALDRALCSGYFTLGKIITSTYGTGGWMGSSPSLDALEKR